VKNNLNPVWSKAFVIDYFFEETQALRFRRAHAVARGAPACPLGLRARDSPLTPLAALATRARSVLDVDGASKGGALSGDPLGSVETTVAAVVAARAGVFTAQLAGSGAKRGSILTVVGEEMAACKGVAVIALRGLKLANRCAPQHHAHASLKRAAL
jgi:hypothetical protein